MEYLTLVQEKINEFFSIPQVEGQEDALIINNLNNKFDEIIFLFCKSILIGEQITNNSDCHQKISEIKSNVSNEDSVTFELTGEIPEVFLKIRESLILFSDIYGFSVSLSRELLLTEGDESIFFNFDKLSNNQTYFTDHIFKNKNDLFFSCLQVFSIDSNFLEDNSTAELLHSTKSDLNKIILNGDLNNIKQILLEKIDFLIAKWVKRKRETESRLFFNENGNVGDLSSIIPENQKLLDWVAYVETHYQFETHWKSEITRKAREIINNSRENEYNVFQLHLLIKYYKDVIFDIRKLKVIYKSLCDKLKQNDFESTYDKYTYSIVSNYALNNYFSLYSKNCDCLDDLKKEYRELTREKDSFDINNFFLEYKLLFHSFRIIKNQLKVETKSQDIEIIKSKFDNVLTKIYKKYLYRVDWSKNHSNYIFQLPANESIVDFDGIKVFFMSSFVLPVPLRRINNDFEEIKIQYESLFNELNILNRVTEKIEENYNVLDEIKKRELKSIEMIGVFTAVISFIIGTVGGFKYIDSFFSALVFILVYSTSLISFLIVLTVFTRGKKTLEDNKINFFLFYLTMISILLSIFIFKPELEKIGKERISVNNKKEVSTTETSIK